MENKKVLGNVPLIVTTLSGTNKEGKEYSFDVFSIKLKDAEIRINPRTEDKALFEYLMGIGKEDAK